MVDTEKNCDNISVKCPNPECGLVLQSPYHTICPLCAEPFPINMLHVEKQSSFSYKLIIIIVLIIVFVAFAAFMTWFCN